MKNNTKILIIIIILIIVIIIGGYFALKPKQQPVVQQVPKTFLDKTSNWKTYANTKYGFKFDYPSNMAFFVNGPEIFNSGTQPSSLENLQLGLSENGDNYLNISIYDNKITKVVGNDYDWNERPCGEMTFSPDDKIDSSTKIQFGGYKTLVLTVKSFKENKYNHFYCINYPLNPVVVSYTDFNQIYTDNQTVAKILSTLKFTK